MGTQGSKWLERAEEVAGKAKEKILLRAQCKADQLIGSMKESYGRATGKKRYVIEGKQQKLKAQTTEVTNR
jgi:uncharacterized protein YjbJ (UPF0337 family)